jgi:uncharacterized protein (DUF1684 family)
LPASLPAQVGTLQVTGSEVKLVPAAGVELRAGDAVLAPGEPTLLASDASGAPTVITAGTVRFQVIERGERLALRVKDSASPALQAFHGLDEYPIDPRWRIVGRFEPYDPPRTLPIPTVLGTSEPMPSPGRVLFTVDGTSYALDAVLEPGEEELFLIFGDATNRDESYGGGRFLYAPPPAPDGTVVLDFNRAYNPPCAFTPYATCPLPPAQNELAVRIEAGEKRYGDGHPG